MYVGMYVCIHTFIFFIHSSLDRHLGYFYILAIVISAAVNIGVHISFQIVAVVQLLSCVWLFLTPWTTACQASLSFTISWSLLKLMSIESVMPSNHLVLCRPLLLLPSIFPSVRVFSNYCFHFLQINIKIELLDCMVVRRSQVAQR